MAEMIRNDNDLATLRLGVRNRSRGGRMVATRAFRGPRALGAEVLSALEALESLPPDLAAQIDRLDRDLEPGRPIWLQIERDAQAAAILPLERAIFGLTGRAAFRIPNFLLNPVKPRAVMRLAICLCEPFGRVDDGLRAGLWRLLDALAPTLQPQGPLEITILADDPQGDLATFLPDHLPIRLLPMAEPLADRRHLETRAARIGNPWLRRLLQSHRRFGLDAVHFLCPSRAFQDRGALMLPEPGITGGTEPVGVEELTACLDLLGCSILGFTVTGGPQGRPRDRRGMRSLAYDLSWARPGAIVLDEVEDHPPEALRMAWAALMGLAPLAPQGPFPTCYLHPELTHQRPEERSFAPGTAPELGDEILSFADPHEHPVALNGRANSRFTLRMMRKAPPEALPETAPATAAAEVLPRDLLQAETARLSLVGQRTQREQAAEMGTWEALEFLREVLGE